jgi:hypothetical protein
MRNKEGWCFERPAILGIAMMLVLLFVAMTVYTTAELKPEMTTRLKDGKTQRWINPISKGVVWDNGMHYDGLLSAQDDPVEGLDSEPADDFMFDVDQPVSDVHWIGGYWSPPEDYDFDWRVTFYDDFGDGTKPGAVIATWVFPNSDVNETNIYLNIFSYSVDLPSPLTFLAGTKYWITIQGIGTYPPYSGWGYHLDPILLHQAVFRSVYWGYPDWTDQSHDMCFQLTYEEWPNHKMHFPQLPDLIGWDVNAKYPKTLADDWQCSETGPVMDIHFWGSWKDIDGNPATDDFYTATPHFFLSIHGNIPADVDTPWSRPGELLWWWQGEIPGTPFDPPTLEGWLNPNTGEVFSNDHVAYWRYDFVDIPDPFIQYEDSIYWLSISTAYIPSPYQWGWKNSRDHFMDDAAYTDNHPVGPWYPIVEPPRYNWFDVQFDATGVPEDLGSTNYYSNGWYFYSQTGWWNMWFYNNPFTYEHPKEIQLEFWVVGPGMVEVALNWSTDLWSLEGVPGRPPLPGDFVDPPIPEDVYIGREHFGLWPEGGPYTIDFWIDNYNPEWVSVDFVGVDAIINGSIWHECVQTSLDLAFVITGETEPELDFGDVPDPPYPTLLVNDGARHTIVPNVFLGATIDPEADGQPDPNALGDDNYGIGDDEDGVVFTTLLMPNCPALVKVTASVAGFIDAWIDYNADGSFEQIFNSQPVSAGDNDLGFWVPPGATPGITFSRFRFSTTGGLGPNGLASDGEVEDYEVTIVEPIENIKMHYPQPPDLEGWDVLATYPLVCADDWECTETGAVTDIYFWGSWLGDSLGNIQGFYLSIHSNIPGPPYSQPGDELWSAYITDFTEFLVGNGAQGWYDPFMPWHIYPDHNNCWQYEITNIPDPFIQQAGNIYWLDIRADVEGSVYHEPPLWGWKTSFEHFEDDAVWAVAEPPYYWFPLTDPLTGITLDLAFVITGEPNNPPYEPSNPIPADGAIDQSIDVDLAWSGGDPDPGNTVTYDIYFGETSPPPLLVPGHHDTTYDPGTLDYETQYFWRIVARDPQGAETSGSEWDFTTEGVPVICGDVNNDGIINIGDVVYLIGYLYRGGPLPIPLECVGDVNNDDIVNIGDVVYLIAYLYRGGPTPDPNCCNPPWK